MAKEYNLGNADDFFNFGKKDTGQDNDNMDEVAVRSAPKGKRKPAAKAKKAPAKKKVYDESYDIEEDDAPPDGFMDQLLQPYPSEDIGGDFDEVKKAKIPKGKIAEHQTLIIQIQQHASSKRFKDAIDQSGLKLTNLENKTIGDLKELLSRIKVVAQNVSSGDGGIVSNAILGGAWLVEKKAGGALDGYQAALQNNDVFLNNIEMMEIDLGVRHMMKPWMHVASALTTTAMGVYGQNKARKEIMDSIDEPAPIRNTEKSSSASSYSMNQPDPDSGSSKVVELI